METKEADKNLTRFYFDASFQGVKRLFVLAFDDTMVIKKLKETVIENISFQE